MTRARKRAASKRPVKRALIPAPSAEPVVDPVREAAKRFDAHIDSVNEGQARLLDVRISWRAVGKAETALAERIELARGGGASWREIGLAVGMTGRGAQKRWDR